MRKFFKDFEYIEEMDTLTIDKEESKHILKVLRHKVGDRFIISNFNEDSFECEIIEASLDKCIVKLLNRVDIRNKSKIDITIFQGYPKGSKLELIVQKLTEIGVKNIVPTLTKRVEVKFSDGKFKLERLTKIMKEACKQCGISTLPHISTPVKIENIKSLSEYDLILIPYENEEIGLKQTLRNESLKGIRNVCIFIGPEGGFEIEEVEYIKKLGGRSVSLGDRILRTETAAIFLSSVLQYEFGDL